MKTLLHEIDLRLDTIAKGESISRSELISMAIGVIESDYSSISTMAPRDRFELILAKIVISFEDVELDALYTALSNSGTLLDETQTMQTMPLAS